MANSNATGRPILENPKAKTIIVRVTQKEKETLQNRAKNANQSISDYLRDALKKHLN